jgi:hypothetical protein
MNRLRILLTVAIVSLSAAPALAITATFKVSGNLGLQADATGCTSHPYTAMCPIADSCSCYKVSKTSLHATNLPPGVTIPPGKTTAFFAVDGEDGTGSAGTCKPVYGEVDYLSDNMQDSVQIFMFGSLCNPFSAGAPLSISGGGAIEEAMFEVMIGPFEVPIEVVGFGTAVGTYSPGSTGQTFTLSLTANASAVGLP